MVRRKNGWYSSTDHTSELVCPGIFGIISAVKISLQVFAKWSFSLMFKMLTIDRKFVDSQSVEKFQTIQRVEMGL